jgi:xanthine dehydrogenase accessory factor
VSGSAGRSSAVAAERLLELDASGQRGVVLTVLEGPHVGAKVLAWLTPLGTVDEDRIEGDRDLPGLSELLAASTRLTRPTLVVHDGVRVLVDVYGPPVRLVVVGAYDVGEQLCALARRLGWATAVLDARERYATTERMPSADELVVAWPAEGLAQLAPDASTAVVVLTHDHKFDVPALVAAAQSPAFYVGALGSRRNQARRRPLLLEAGLTAAQVDRISGPCGLDLGGETPPETALSIIAEILARRRGHDGGPLRDSGGAIHRTGTNDSITVRAISADPEPPPASTANPDDPSLRM